MAAIMGSCVAGGAYLPIMSAEAHIVEGTGSIFLAGPHLVQAAIGGRIDIEELGGDMVQCDIFRSPPTARRWYAAPAGWWTASRQTL